MEVVPRRLTALAGARPSESATANGNAVTQTVKRAYDVRVR